LDKNLIQRIVSGLIYGLIIFLCTTSYGSTFLYKAFHLVVKQSYLFYGLMTFFLVVGLYECIKVMKLKSWLWIFVCLAVVALIYYRFSYRYFGLYFFSGIQITDVFGWVLFALAVITLFRFPLELNYDNGKMIFTAIYVALPFGFALGLPNYLPMDPFYLGWEVFMMFVLIWSSDTFAYFAGRFWGKHKMAPTISPKKTWEGFAGGAVCTLIIGGIIEYSLPGLKGNWIVVGLLVAVFAPLGDLMESRLKRIFHVKDSGNIIPGHGGILDRLDSFMLCVPVIYIYFIITNSI